MGSNEKLERFAIVEEKNGYVAIELRTSRMDDPFREWFDGCLFEPWSGIFAKCHPAMTHFYVNKESIEKVTTVLVRNGYRQLYGATTTF